ncbi:MAG: di-heme oxidoredictase family protein [Bacteroidota bacterium]
MVSSRQLISYSTIALVIAFVAFQSCRKPKDVKEEDLNEWYSGGKQTTFASGTAAFSQPFNELSHLKDAMHEFGDQAFGATFNSDNTQLNHGLGPIFNNQSCGFCHIADGRGKAPMAGEALSSLLLRISIPGQGPHGEPLGVPGFGGQLQQRGIFGVLAEAGVNVSYSETNYQFADGETYSLRKPAYTIVNPYMAMPAGVMVSARMATPVFGLGLLEAIDEGAILNKADEFDSDGDGISGKPNYGFDVLSQTTKLGRFGWKAAQPTIIQQSAGAAVEDMGVTNFIFPTESSMGQLQYDNKNDDYELGDSTLYALAYYIKTLAVPGRRNADDATVKGGKRLFTSIGCAKCHVASYTTATDIVFPEVSNQIIYPYTDLLLHDMGPDLADNRPDYRATGNEWRTAPLWGIGLTTTVNGHNNFLHDGRARSLTEAIMWHGGEATKAKENFQNLSKESRDAILKFLGSL